MWGVGGALRDSLGSCDLACAHTCDNYIMAARGNNGKVLRLWGNIGVGHITERDQPGGL